MGAGASKALFLKKFPEFKEQWERNHVRTKGFVKFTKTTKNVDSIDTSALPLLQRINDLGFFTLDSQLGDNKSQRAYCEGFIPRQLMNSFVHYMNECSEALEFVVYPNVDTDIALSLDNGEVYTKAARYSEDIVRDEIVEFVLNAGYRGSTESYYTGPPVGYIDIDLNSWVLILIFDSRWGHSALDKETGLFSCIEKSLLRALSPQSAGGRRKTFKKKRLMSKKYCKNTPCRRMGFTQKASCRPYKNCYQ
jgi:hypothetical protein